MGGSEFAEMQPHIHCKPGDVAPFALIPGDPGRARRIAGFLGDARLVAENREFTVYTGTHQGAPVTVCSTGIGAPSATIAVEELGRVGVKTFIRVGSAGGLQEFVNPGDLVIATAAYRGEGASHRYIEAEYPAVADLGVTLALQRAATELGVPVHVGLVSSGDSFYAPKPPGFVEKLQAANVLAGEMECSAVFVVASLRGWRAGSILAIDGNILRHRRKQGTKEAEFLEAEERAIQVALRALRLLLEPR